MQHWGVVPVLQPSCSPAPVRYLAVPSCWQSMTCGLTLSHPAALPICAALQEKKTVQVLFLVQFTLLFWGRQALYLGISSVSALCYPASTRLLPRLLLIVLFFFILQSWGAAQVCQPLLFSTENIICVLNGLHAFLVQLTVKTGGVDTLRLLKNLYKTYWATAYLQWWLTAVSFGCLAPIATLCLFLFKLNPLFFTAKDDHCLNANNPYTVISCYGW